VSHVEHAEGWIERTELIVRDPAPESLSLRRLPPQEIVDTFTLIKVTVQG
jgi:hypothetical protein